MKSFHRLLASCLLLTCLGASAQKNNDYDTLPNLPDHYLKRMDVFTKEIVLPNKVMFVGNSITEMGNWRKLLNDSTVVNRGISGDVTFGVLHRLGEIIKHKPSHLFLLIGINDLSRNTPDEIIISNIFTIISKIRGGSPGTKIYVQSILPVNDQFTNLDIRFKGKNDHIATINEQVGKYADKFHFQFIDLHHSFLSKEGAMDKRYVTDGLHLSDAGYLFWIQLLKDQNIL